MALKFSSSPALMGILNITPDSFYDGGELWCNGKVDIDAALKQAQWMADQGADILDIGGESTRPGAEKVSLQMELDRVLPTVEAIKSRISVKLSIDSSSPEVMLSAAKYIDLINDVRALSRSGALNAAAASGLPVCLMHMQGEPGTMQNAPNYSNVVEQVMSFFSQRISACVNGGISRENIILDPGFGFGKNDQHNLALLRALPKLKSMGFPILVGLSRKSMIGRLLNREVEQRLAGSLALAVTAMQKGADIIRVHDIAATADVIKMIQLVEQ